MDVKEIKRILYEDTTKIIRLMTSLGFHDFTENKEEIRCALPDKSNSSAVMVKKNESLYTSLFELGYNGDLVGAIQKIKDWSFIESIDYISNILGLSSGKSQIMIDPLHNLKNLSKGIYLESKENKKFDENKLDRFVPVIHSSLLEEGINPEIIRQFRIMFDVERQRIIFPHYDWIKYQKIVGIKGRTVFSQQEIDLLNIPKYWNYIKGYRKTLNLYGYNQTHKGIKENKRIILFEGEKSVLKECTYNNGFGSSVALGGHNISQTQSDFILSHTPGDCEIIMAFDKDVWTKEEEGEAYVKELAGRFKPFRKVSAIIDQHNILGDKDSPIDKGYKVWQYLLKWRKEI